MHTNLIGSHAPSGQLLSMLRYRSRSMCASTPPVSWPASVSVLLVLPASLLCSAKRTLGSACCCASEPNTSEPNTSELSWFNASRGLGGDSLPSSIELILLLVGLLCKHCLLFGFAVVVGDGHVLSSCCIFKYFSSPTKQRKAVEGDDEDADEGRCCGCCCSVAPPLPWRCRCCFASWCQATRFVLSLSLSRQPSLPSLSLFFKKFSFGCTLTREHALWHRLLQMLRGTPRAVTSSRALTGVHPSPLHL